jgi:hypothetical protein
MAAPSLEPLSINQPLGTPAAEWAQQTVEAIDPNASKGVFTDPSGNPTTDKSKSALDGEPGHGVNADKTTGQLDSRRFAVQPPAIETNPAANETATAANEDTTPTNERPRTRPAPKLFTDAQGNPTENPAGNALFDTPGTAEPLPSASASVASTPGGQLPGGWIRGPGKFPFVSFQLKLTFWS